MSDQQHVPVSTFINPFSMRYLIVFGVSWPIGTNHFGYEGKTRFYWYKTVAQRYLRIWKANPVKRADGTWDSYDGGIDVAFTLQPEVKRKFLALVAQDMLMPSLVDLRGLE